MEAITQDKYNLDSIIYRPIAEYILIQWKRHGISGYGYLSAIGPVSPNMTQEEWEKLKINWPKHQKSFDINDPDIINQMVKWCHARPMEKYDLYNSVYLSNDSKHRTKENMLPSCVLESDIDDVPISKFTKYSLEPSKYWETSPGKYQGLWILDKQTSIDEIEALNKHINKVFGCDNGHTVTKMLRIPSTMNLKPKHIVNGVSPKISKVQGSGKIYSYSEFIRLLEVAEKNNDNTDKDIISDPISKIPYIESEWYDYLIKKNQSKLSEDVLKLLRFKGTPEVGERSTKEARIHYDLLNGNVDKLEHLILVKNSPWNKFQGRPDEDKRIYEARLKFKNDLITEGKLKNNNVLTLNPLDASAILNNPPMPVEWIVQNLIEKGQSVLIAADGGLGKTTTMFDMCLDISQGNTWLVPPAMKTSQTIINGGRITKKCKIIYFDLEESSSMIHRRLDRLNKTRPRTIAPNEFIIVRDNLDLTLKEHQEAIRNYLKSLSADGVHLVVIFDSFVRLSGDSDENSARDVKPITKFITEVLAHTDGYTTITLHHTTKDGLKFRGSSELKNGVDTVLILTASQTINSPEREITKEKTRGEDIIPVRLKRVRFDDGSFYFEEIIPLTKEEKVQSELGERKAAIVKLFDDNTELNTKQILDATKGLVNEKLTKTALKSLLDDGVLSCVEGKSNEKIYSLVDDL